MKTGHSVIHHRLDVNFIFVKVIHIFVLSIRLNNQIIFSKEQSRPLFSLDE